MKWQFVLGIMMMQVHLHNQQEEQLKTPKELVLFKKLLRQIINNGKNGENMIFKSNDNLSVAAVLEIMTSSKIIDQLADIFAAKVLKKFQVLNNSLDERVKDSVEMIEVVL